MSHFTVAVITRGRPSEEGLEAILAPYDENREVLHYITKEQLIARVRENITSYAETCYADYLKDKDKYVAKYKDNPNHIKYITKTFPEKLKWTDEQCYTEALSDYEAEDIMPDGSVKSTYNPNSKWDWWQVGGRWAGYLYVKEDSQGSLGEKSWTWGEESPYECDHKGLKKVDCARIKDLVFPDTEKQAKDAARFWELYIEGAPALTDHDNELIKFVWYKPEYYTEHYKTKENYVRACSTFTTYAAVTKDGQWHEQGQMGWFGMSFDDDEVGWADSYYKLIFENADEDDYITIVDCHI